MDASLLTVAKSMYCLFKYAVYISYLFLVIFFHADSSVRSLLAVLCQLFFTLIGREQLRTP